MGSSCANRKDNVKKQTARTKLKLKKETIRSLLEDDLVQVAGGVSRHDCDSWDSLCNLSCHQH